MPKAGPGLSLPARGSFARGSVVGYIDCQRAGASAPCTTELSGIIPEDEPNISFEEPGFPRPVASISGRLASPPEEVGDLHEPFRKVRLAQRSAPPWKRKAPFPFGMLRWRSVVLARLQRMPPCA